MASLSQWTLPKTPSSTLVLSSSSSLLSSLRGGSVASTDTDLPDTQQPPPQEEEVEDPVKKKELDLLQSYRLQQQMLLQLRGTYLGEALARRGLPIATVADVSTPEGLSPPQSIDWDCALSTESNPMSCLFSFDAEPGTKVIAPLGSTNWIGLSTLNRLRREDPTKVEPMWHTKYAILKSWFDAESEYSLLQHVGVQGFILNSILQGIRLQLVLGCTIVFLTVLFLPLLEYMANRFLVSSFFWSQWPKWYRFAHAALPLKIFIGQFTFGYLSKGFTMLTKHVKDILVEMECNLFETCIPLTVGVPDIAIPSKRNQHPPPSGPTSSEEEDEDEEDAQDLVEEEQEDGDEDDEEESDE